MGGDESATSADPQLPRAWAVIAFWPIIVALVSIVPLAGAVIVADGETPEVLATLRLIGSWAGPLYDDALSLIAIIATFLVTLAAAAGFAGDWKEVPRIGRLSITATLSVSLAALGFIAMFAAPALIAGSVAVGRVLFVLIAGWLTALVGMTVVEVGSPEQRRTKARDAWRARRARAAGVGLTRRDHVPVHRRLIAELLVCVAPLAAWTLLGTVLALIVLGDAAYLAPSIAVVGALNYGPVIVILGWHATADLSESRRSRGWYRLAGNALGMLVSTILGAAVITSTVLAPLGWAIIAYTALLEVVLSLEQTAQRCWPLRLIQQDMTAHALQRARRAYRAARRAAPHGSRRSRSGSRMP
ncbi:hypothetical protein [Microbacterium sp.]|uniref:hypothetical protein n=1 Tax=Microbacterium sp. TaxID=51671 RepID=UPI0039E218A3